MHLESRGRSANELKGSYRNNREQNPRKLIRSLENQSDAYRCYVISGKRCINFYRDFLEYTSNGWISFNKNNNYLEERPEW